MSARRPAPERKVGIGLLVAGIGLLTAIILGVVGSYLLFDSTGTATIEPSGLSGPVRRIPEVPTALIGVADESGRLTSVVALALDPSGVGGKIMPVSASADTGAGRTGTLTPLAAVVSQRGVQEFLSGSENVTNLQFDMAEIVDANRFAQLMEPLGDLTVELPNSVSDTRSGTEWQAGSQTFSATEAGEVLTAVNAWAEDWYNDPARYAVWDAVASKATTLATGGTPDGTAPGSIDDFVRRLFTGPVQSRGLGLVRLDLERINDEYDPDLKDVFGKESPRSVVVHDSSEVAMVASAVAPGRVGDTLDATRYRLVVGFEPADMESIGWNRQDATKEAIDRLTFKRVNVPSVASLTTTPIDVTRIAVADESLIDEVKSQTDGLFGDVEVVVAEEPIVGIDVEVTLGRSFLSSLGDPPTVGESDESATPNTVSTGSDGSDSTTAPDATSPDSTDPDSTGPDGTSPDSTLTTAPASTSNAADAGGSATTSPGTGSGESGG